VAKQPCFEVVQEVKVALTKNISSITIKTFLMILRFFIKIPLANCSYELLFFRKIGEEKEQISKNIR
jgi:hypothetical protein